MQGRLNLKKRERIPAVGVGVVGGHMGLITSQ